MDDNGVMLRVQHRSLQRKHVPLQQPSRIGRPIRNQLGSVMWNRGKRKGSSSDSLYHPVAKQQITEARITHSMQEMSLFERDQQATNCFCDEGFEELTDFDSDDVATATTDIDSNLPRYHLPSDVRKKISTLKDSILPKQIIETIQQPNLALVPYKPRAELLFLSKAQKIGKENSRETMLEETNCWENPSCFIGVGRTLENAYDDDEMMID